MSIPEISFSSQSLATPPPLETERGPAQISSPLSHAQDAGGIDFKAALTDAFETVQRYAGDVPKAPRVPTDKLAALKADLLPSPYLIHPTRSDAGATALQGTTPTEAAPIDPPEVSEGTELLIKSFDHAMSLALLNQVVSGISSTTSSLLRQT